MTTVHIVGAGVAGLALAGQLPPDWDVHLHESRWSARTVPTLYGLQAAGLRALEQLGLREEFDRRSVRVTGGMLADAHGSPLVRMDGVGIQLIPRPELQEMLRALVPPTVSVHRHEVRFPLDLRADLLVGADGVHSRVRREVWGPRSAARRLGTTVVRGVLDVDPVGGRFQEVWRPGGLFGITPRPGGGVNWFSTVPAQRFSSREQALDALRQRWTGFADDPQRVLAHADPALTLVNDVWVSRWPGRLVRPTAQVPGSAAASSRAVLIGDAAHAMAPNLGRGANEALSDAATLGRLLRAEPSLPHALRRYEAIRLVLPQLARTGSTLAHRLSTTRHDRVRNTLLRRVPSSA